MTALAAVAFTLLMCVALLRFVQLFTLYHAQNAELGLILRAYQWNAGDRLASDADALRILAEAALNRLDFFSQGASGRLLVTEVVHRTVDVTRANLLAFGDTLREAIAQNRAIEKQALDGLEADVIRLGIAATSPMFLSVRDNIFGLRDFYSTTLAEMIVLVLLILASGAFIVTRLVASFRNAIRAEKTMRRDRDFSNLLLESSDDGVIAFDAQGRCTHCNPVMDTFFPAPAGQEVVGQPIKEAYRLPEDHEMVAMMRDTLAGRSLHLPARPLPGSDRFVEQFTHPVRSDKAIVGGVLLLRDVTETHLARVRLEETVRERTRDLEGALERETRLRELYKGFVSMVSHQFRTPLSIVDSSAQRMIRRGREMDEGEIRDRAGKIRMATLRLTRLVSSTLNAAKLDAGEIDFTLRRCDLRRLVAEACERQQETAPDRHFAVHLETLPDWVHCDPLLIDQVVGNLLSNAVKYSSASVEVTAEADDRWIRVKVSDRGVGIPEEERDRLFERFFRARTALGIEGTGIGLHVARTIARMHGGDVDATPRDGGGSTFTLTIPKEATA